MLLKHSKRIILYKKCNLTRSIILKKYFSPYGTKKFTKYIFLPKTRVPWGPEAPTSIHPCLQVVHDKMFVTYITTQVRHTLLAHDP